MARNKSSKPNPGSVQSFATTGFDLSAANNNMAALPGQLFHRTQIPVYLCFLAKNKNADAKRGFRDRRQLIEPAT
jgi:type I restriction-modification system DNA methylase subunit